MQVLCLDVFKKAIRCKTMFNVLKIECVLIDSRTKPAKKIRSESAMHKEKKKEK